MTKLSIPHNAWVLVSDGQKALFLRNAGDERFPNLRTERVLVEENPPTHEQGTDRPGRSFKHAGTHSRSSVETTDWHELGEASLCTARRCRHARADARAQHHRAGCCCATAHACGITARISPHVQKHIVAEIDPHKTPAFRDRTASPRLTERRSTMRLHRPKGPVDCLALSLFPEEIWKLVLLVWLERRRRSSHSLHLSYLRGVLIQVNEGAVVPQYHEFSDATAAVDNRAKPFRP
jgi:protein required for attachment to host cells